MSTELKAIQRGYDRWAEVYDHDANPLLALEEPILRATIGNQIAGVSILELGCGTGRHTAWLASAGAKVTAVDFSVGMLEQARKKLSADNVTFLTHDLHEPIPLADEMFEMVVSGLLLEHIRKLHPFFSEARRVLKPGGRMVVSNMHPSMFLRGAQARFTDPASGELVQPGSIVHSVGSMVMSALKAGFQVLDIGEFSPDEQLAADYPRAARYVGWPMLVVLNLTR